MNRSLGLFLVFAPVVAGPAAAQSSDYMIEYCQTAAQQFYASYEAEVQATYEGQRTDGTHAVNGTISLENAEESFQCSFNAVGDTLVDFWTEQKSWPEFVSGEPSPYQAN